VIAFLTPVRDFDKRWRGSIPTRFSDRNSGYEEISVHFLKKLLERFERLERFEPNLEEAQHAESFTVDSLLVALELQRARPGALLSR
jgi:CRISPR/Cas system-associated protein Cas10 (large subunit of type III CRISPR-Cas system)